jgi:hypothetical protein
LGGIDGELLWSRTAHKSGLKVCVAVIWGSGRQVQDVLDRDKDD